MTAGRDGPRLNRARKRHVGDYQLAISARCFGENLRLLRVQRNLSQRELADVSRVVQQTISCIENGREPRWVTACQLADALGVSLDELRHRDRAQPSERLR